MIELRKADQRGRADFGWLDSRHSFSFGSYYDPAQMGFSALRVINDDIVSPGAGFATHGHRDMEIISYVLQGSIEHKDSEGHVQRMQAGEFQLMSAGSGIYHSEYNASDTLPLRFLQIWIQPDRVGEAPDYQQQAFEMKPGLTAIVTPNGADGTLRIKQDARLYRLNLNPGESLSYENPLARHVYVHLIEGELDINQTVLSAGDGAKIADELLISLTSHGQQPVTALVFDLP
ncbi:pirin family protein [Vibrio sp.]|uniref:pirin family protein n=1 Tax=Vibrio sp. TaxID=678 RepID=UPI003D1122A6